MANPGHLIRRTSQREMLVPQMSIDRMELRDLRNRLVQENGGHSYGTTNQGFEEPQKKAAPKRRRTISIPEEQAIQSPTRSEKAAAGIVPKEGDEEASGETSDAIAVGVKPGDTLEEDRESWDSKWQYLLAVIGYAVGLGSVWRFPYLCQKNGGGAFLFPYLIMLAVEGIPIFYLELAVGQRLRKGAVGVWNQVSPYCGGIGVASAFVSLNVALYYNTIIAWCLYYLAESFRSPLPWSDCPKEYFDNGSYIVVRECVKSSPTEYFWYRETLDISQDVSHPNHFNWRIGTCLFVAWLLTYLCMAKGIASSGKVVYVTATFPYLVLAIFFVRGISLPGMEDGILYLVTPDWGKILDPSVWLDAGTQIFFSLGLAFGGLIAFSSYNPVHNNCFRDAVLCGLINCFTAIFAAVVVFSILGFKAHITYDHCLEERNILLKSLMNATETIELPVCDLKTILKNSASGTGLAFIVFTEAINQFPWAPLWSILFFLMLFTLGIDSEFGTLEGVITSIVDLKMFPNIRKEFLTGSRPGAFWLLCWKYISPLLMMTILMSSIIEQILEGSGYDAWDASKGLVTFKQWPVWAWGIVALLVLVSILWIPGIAFTRLCGIHIIQDEEPAWFPIDDLREYHGIGTHKVTEIERRLFCIQEDGSEGLCCIITESPESEEPIVTAATIVSPERQANKEPQKESTDPAAVTKQEENSISKAE